jgi:hypothetical protein
MLIVDWYEIHVTMSLAVVGGILLLAIAASAIRRAVEARKLHKHRSEA